MPESLGGLPPDLVAVLTDPDAQTVPVDRPLVLNVGAARAIVGAPIEAAIRGEVAAFDRLLETEATALPLVHPNAP